MQYRLAEKSDIPTMARIRATEWETEQFWTARMTGYLDCTHHPQRALAPRVIYVAVDKDLLVGFIAGHLTSRFGCDGELQWIDVISERRRSGIGSELVRLLASWFVKQKVGRVCVNVSPGNVDARRFYRRHGALFFNEQWMVWNNVGFALTTANH